MRLIKGLTKDKRGHMMRGRVQSGSYIESVKIMFLPLLPYLMEYFICQYIVKHRWHIQSIIKYNNEQSKRAGGQFLLSSAKTDTLVQWLSFIFISIVI